MMTYQPEVNDHRREIIKAVRQRIQLTRWREAYALAEQEHLFEDLSLWGEYNQLVDLCRGFLPQPEWQPERKQAITIYLYLGRAYSALGNEQQALESLRQALRISREIGYRQGEGTALNSIGMVYNVLGNRQQALESLQQALHISREIGYRQGEGMALNGIGMVYVNQGQGQQALESLQQALRISREIGYRRGEGIALSYIGGIHVALGNRQQGLESQQQALRIYHELGEQRGEELVRAAAFLAERALNVHSALGKKPPLQASRTPMLVVRRVSGPAEGQLVPIMGPLGAVGMDLRTKPEPPIQISLDGKEIGTIWPPKRSAGWAEALVEPPPEGEGSQFEIQAGHHNLSLDVSRFQAIYYMAFTGVAPAIQSFDIAPGETVTFLCQYTPATRGYMIRLQKQ